MGKVLFFTGLSGSGKSTLAENLKKRLDDDNMKSIILDGDFIRKGLCSNLGFSKDDRKENIRRIAEVVKILSNSDERMVIMVAFISPYRDDRNNARDIIGDMFYEVFMSTTLNVCEKRDVKGLYKKARTGEIKHFTGVSDPYEIPENPEIVIDTDKLSIKESVDIIYKNIF